MEAQCPVPQNLESGVVEVFEHFTQLLRRETGKYESLHTHGAPVAPGGARVAYSAERRADFDS